MATALIKNILYKSLAEGVYRDVVTRTSSYYYFLGKTLAWDDENTPPTPVDSYTYDLNVRNEIITIKEIKPSDVAFVIPRRNWISDFIYDMYDDKYSDQVLGINIVSGGSGYINVDDIVITIEGGNGTGATAVATEAYRGGISKVVLTNPGSGYTSVPTVTVTSNSGVDAVMEATMGISATGAQKIEDAAFYVVTDEYNVYKCLDNNNNARSSVKPTGTQLDPIKTSDGYIWKFMYNIPINLRNKFYTDEYIPVVSALTNSFYSNGNIDNIFIANKGKDYTSAVVSVTGDGYRSSDPIFINQARVVAEGTGYTTPTIEFSPPFTAASAFIGGNAVNLGQIIFNADSYDYYEVVTPGTMTLVPPTHRFGTIQNGSAALKFVGTRLAGEITTRNDKNITHIEITNAGNNYTSVPTVEITDDTGALASAVATIPTMGLKTSNNGQDGVIIVNGGTGYVTPTAEVIGGGGSGAIIAITNVLDGVIQEVRVLTPGTGYTTVPQIVVTDSAGSGAQLTAVLQGNGINSIVLNNQGSGYTNPTVTISGGGGSGATAAATVETGVIDDITLYGSVRDVVVLNSGSGYLQAPEVVIGNAVDRIELIDGGSGYTSAPTIILKGDGVGATAEATVADGAIQTISITNRGYGYTLAPTVVIDGDGIGANAVSHLVGGAYAVVKSKLYADKVISTYVVNSGYDYVEVPSVSFGTAFQQGREVYTNEQFSYGNNLYTVVQAGIFGSKEPLHVSGTVLTSEAFEPNTPIAFGETVYVEDRMYEVVVEGTTGNDAPTHTSGIEANGTAELEYVGIPASLRRDGEVATGYAVLRYGAGYSVTPEITITDPAGLGTDAEINFFTSKSEAKIAAIIAEGQVAYLVVEDAGVGYTKAAITVSGNGTGASLIPDLSLGSISSQQANNEILTPNGTIDAIAIVSGGYSYGVANISIQGDGEGAEAEAVIDPVTNSITKINITNRGTNYTWAKVTVVGNGQGAELRAIISPYGGHGKNSPEELYTRSLMFYSNISTDLNQGVVVGNDYRQVGIIKNPRVFDGYEKYQGAIGSACYIIQSPIDVSKFEKDDDLYIERITHPGVEWEPSLDLTIGDFVWAEDNIYTVVVSGLGGSVMPTHTSGSAQNGFAVLTYVGSTKSQKNYRIVSVSSSSALVQSLDNDIPTSNDAFVKTSSINDKFIAVTVGNPNFDKYSGQLMYIDNKQGFTPSGDETITLRTIIQF